jgi:hypothetical protein
VVGHQERQGEDAELRHGRGPVDRRAAEHVDYALTHRRELAVLLSLDERGPGVLLDVDAAVGPFLHQGEEDLAALAPGERRRHDRRHLVLGLVGALGMGEARQADGGDAGRGQRAEENGAACAHGKGSLVGGRDQ